MARLLSSETWSVSAAKCTRSQGADAFMASQRAQRKPEAKACPVPRCGTGRYKVRSNGKGNVKSNSEGNVKGWRSEDRRNKVKGKFNGKFNGDSDGNVK